jgi:DNA-binding GntR family transcriptional regulator
MCSKWEKEAEEAAAREEIENIEMESSEDVAFKEIIRELNEAANNVTKRYFNFLKYLNLFYAEENQTSRT